MKPKKGVQIFMFFIFMIASLIVFSAAIAAVGDTTRVSVDSDGNEGNGHSYGPSISMNGRFVAFYSEAANLVAEDENNNTDIFVHDRDTGETTLVSLDSDGAQANGSSELPSISGNGRYVAFTSYASNLVAGDNPGVRDVFIHDRVTGDTLLVSAALPGQEAGGDSFDAAFSADGRYVAFSSDAHNLVENDIAYTDVFVYELLTGQISRVSVDPDGMQAYGYSFDPSISADGRYVAFVSNASNLVAGGTNGKYHVFVHDRDTGQNTLVSVDSDGVQGNDYCYVPAISADGRYVAFHSDSTNLVADDTNVNTDVFVHDIDTGVTSRVSVASDGTQGNGGSYHPSISGDGRYVAYHSISDNLVPEEGYNVYDIFLFDRSTGKTSRLSVSSDGIEGYANSFSAVISSDGGYVAFHSDASNLVENDNNGFLDVYVHELSTPTVNYVYLPLIITSE
ncbi:MAG TPA: hypothetical protein VIM80_01175 [Brevefilum sp.]